MTSSHMLIDVMVVGLNYLLCNLYLSVFIFYNIQSFGYPQYNANQYPILTVFLLIIC